MAQQPLTPGEVAEFVGFKMPAEDNDFLAQVAKAAKITKSELIRMVVQERLKRERSRLAKAADPDN